MAYIGDQLDIFAGKTPDGTALTCGAVEVSWRDLFRAIGSAENHIRRLSPRGGRIALLLRDPAELIVWFFACARTARVAVVMDPDWPPAQKTAVLAGIDADLEIDAAACAALREVSAAAPAISSPAEEPPPAEDDFFYAGFTSGSSGTPKGYIRMHGSWLESFALTRREFPTAPRPPGRVVLAGQLTHSLHLYGAVCGLASGQEVVLLPRFEPRAVLAELRNAPAGAVLYATPTQLHYLAEGASRGEPVETVVQVFASGAKWRDEDRRALRKVFPKADLIEFYGASEASFITVAKPEENVPAGSVGRAAAGVRIAIGDPAAPAPAGVTGSIWVKSSLLFSGYICGHAPETRWQDGWLTLGDHGFVDAAGFLFLTGRENRMIITSGLNVYPEEVEEVLSAHPAVAIAVVAGLADKVRGQRLEAAVQLSLPLEDAETVLLRHCRAHLAAGKLPRKIHVRHRLPLTAGGKPDIQKIIAELQRKESM
ncbi:AMP-binding protein [Roseibium salinum]|uniref:AMP-binding protein n=1 Tax=Roseibium salinum TaxID=1604349 RepID=A0ABT3R610_9HYPH|nr:AMP-binding protein [Roseibium sp. DSM 29163]MCX2724683.1 AMP-binding protein [Roseibium sp. DSM 29163]